MKLLGKEKETEELSKREVNEIIEEIRKCRSAHRREEPQNFVAKMCLNLIIKELVCLDDLPKELANTVANIYYNYCEFLGLMMAVENGDISQSAMVKELGIDKIGKDFATSITKILPFYQSKVMVDYNTINGIINNLRQIDKDQDMDQYQLAVDFAIAVMKYNIDPNDLINKRAHVIEKRLKENVVDEIPNLIELLKV